MDAERRTDSPYAREGSDPSCTVPTTFAELQPGDHVDYWGPARRVTGHAKYDTGSGRVTITVINEAGGRDVATGPGYEPVWRMRRPHERAPGTAQRRQWMPCADCRTEITCEEQRDIDRCP